MYIKKLVKRGLAVCTFLCAMSAVSSWAASAGNICFLPSGECSEDSVHVKAVKVSGGGTSVNTGKNCYDLGYTNGYTDNWNNPPTDIMNTDGSLKCVASCGSDAPLKECIATCKTTSRVCYACDTEDQTTTRHYAWSCTRQCGDLLTKEERDEKIGLCYKWSQKMIDGNICYKPILMEDFVPQNEKDENYDESCYNFVETFVADGNITCYKPERKTCKKGEYLAVLTNEGVVPEKCACKPYELDFSIKENGKRGVKPSLRADLTFGPKEETKIVDVTSLEHGDDEDVVVPYSIPSEVKACKCQISKISDGTQLKITCAANPTGETLKCNVTAQQDTSGVRATNRPGDAVITLTVKPDECPGDLSIDAACTEGYQPKADETQTSETGQACYKCLNDVCEGDATRGATPEPKNGYVTTYTEFGTECYIPNICPEGFSTDFQSANDCTKNNHQEGWSFNSEGYSGDKLCGKCTPTVCNGDGYVEKCIPDPDRLCEDLDAAECPWNCVTVQAGDDTLYNCNPKACTKGSTAIKTAADCTSNGHPEGWTVKEVAKSGNESCNECEAKPCVGDGFTHKCEPQPRCLNEADESCGYKDITPEYEGDTPKYNSNDKVCPTDYSVEFQSVNDCTKNGHPEGWNFEQKGKAGELLCGKCTPKVCTGMNRDVQCKPNPLCAAGTTCGFKDFITEYEGDTPKYDANIIRCETGYSTETTSCGGEFTLKTNGVSGNAAGETKTCGKCVCEKVASGNWTLNTNTCTLECKLPAKANYAIVNCEYVCNLPQKANYAIVNCEYVCDLPEKAGYKIENCEYIPICQVGDGNSYGQPGTWNSFCLQDSDCQSSGDFSLICVNKDEYGCGRCLECGDYKGKKGLAVCKMKGIRDKGHKWFYVEATEGQACEKMIGNHCMVKSPTQQYSQLFDGGDKKSYGDGNSGESKDCQNADGSCKAGCYPDVDHDNDEPYHFHRCQKPYEGEETWGCTTWGECIWKPGNADSWTCDSDGICQSKSE